ncbi:MAG: hypothetical protein GY941_21625 [Planctomycetes bacterium]|nr:hypothetical protein [Planctomycetota bacterium]
MADEITHNTITGLALYACRFNTNGTVFLTDGSASETWGTAGRDADDYDVAMVEEASSGHYKADFDTLGNIAEDTYKVVVYRRLTGTAADSDPPIAQGELYWDGSAEINLYTIDADINTLIASRLNVLNVYDERGTIKLGGVYPIITEESEGGVYP